MSAGSALNRVLSTEMGFHDGVQVQNNKIHI